MHMGFVFVSCFAKPSGQNFGFEHVHGWASFATFPGHALLIRNANESTTTCTGHIASDTSSFAENMFCMSVLLSAGWLVVIKRIPQHVQQNYLLKRFQIQLRNHGQMFSLIICILLRCLVNRAPIAIPQTVHCALEPRRTQLCKHFAWDLKPRCQNGSCWPPLQSTTESWNFICSAFLW